MVDSVIFKHPTTPLEVEKWRGVHTAWVPRFPEIRQFCFFLFLNEKPLLRLVYPQCKISLQQNISKQVKGKKFIRLLVREISSSQSGIITFMDFTPLQHLLQLLFLLIILFLSKLQKCCSRSLSSEEAYTIYACTDVHRETLPFISCWASQYVYIAGEVLQVTDLEMRTSLWRFTSMCS